MEILKQNRLFAGMDDIELDLLARKMDSRKVPRNVKIFEQGDTDTSLYIVSEGLIKITALDEENNIEVTLTTVKAGEYFGEMALISDSSRSASAKAVVETELYRLTRETLQSVSAERPSVAVKMYENFSRILSERLQNTSQELLKLVQAEPGKTRPTLNLAEYISQKIPVKLLLADGDSITGTIERFGRNLDDKELTFRFGKQLMIIPYSQIRYLEIVHKQATHKVF